MSVLPLPFPQQPREVSIGDQIWPSNNRLPVISGELDAELSKNIPKLSLDFTLTDDDFMLLGSTLGIIIWWDVITLANDLLEISTLEGGLVFSSDRQNDMAVYCTNCAILILKDRKRKCGLDYEVGPTTIGTHSIQLTPLAELQREDVTKTVDVMPLAIKRVGLF
jgi:hypothetical protein